MSNRNNDWTIDVPRDQNKPASYRSSYIKGVSLGENTNSSSFIDSLKRSNKKPVTEKASSSKIKT